MIDAREFDVAVRIMPDMAALDGYLDATAGSLFAAAATVGGGDTRSAPTPLSGLWPGLRPYRFDAVLARSRSAGPVRSP